MTESEAPMPEIDDSSDKVMIVYKKYPPGRVILDSLTIVRLPNGKWAVNGKCIAGDEKMNYLVGKECSFSSRGIADYELVGKDEVDERN